MRSFAMLACTAASLASCGPKPLTLPEQLIDRAATCGVVAAATARVGTDMKSPLSFEAQGETLRYPLIAGSQGESFSADAASSVSKRMSELQESITGGKWQDLQPACAAALSDVGKKSVELPADRFEAQLACDELADFMTKALESQESDYGNELAEYRELGRKLDAPLGAGLKSRAGEGLEGQQAERRKALSAAARLGSPVAVLKQCIARYG